MDKLNLGCGGKHLPGFVNADIDPNCNPDILLKAGEKLPFPDKRFEMVLMDNVVEHMDSIETLIEVKRILKIDGKLFLIVPNCFYWKKRIHYLFGSFKANDGFHYDHRWILKPSFLKEFLEFYGFEVNKVNDLFDRDIKIVARRRG